MQKYAPFPNTKILFGGCKGQVSLMGQMSLSPMFISLIKSQGTRGQVRNSRQTLQVSRIFQKKLRARVKIDRSQRAFCVFSLEFAYLRQHTRVVVHVLFGQHDFVCLLCPASDPILFVFGVHRLRPVANVCWLPCHCHLPFASAYLRRSNCVKATW
jgi:hypothetical protein